MTDDNRLPCGDIINVGREPNTTNVLVFLPFLTFVLEEIVVSFIIETAWCLSRRPPWKANLSSSGELIGHHKLTFRGRSFQNVPCWTCHTSSWSGNLSNSNLKLNAVDEPRQRKDVARAIDYNCFCSSSGLMVFYTTFITATASFLTGVDMLSLKLQAGRSA